MTLLNTVNIGGTDFGLANNSVLGTCATPAGSEVKVCTFSDSFELKAGLNIAVKFTYANTYGDGSTTYPKLSVNGTSYPIKRSDDSYVRSGDWANGQTAVFMFNGTDFIFTNPSPSTAYTLASLPTDAVLHYSFDDIPDLPDGTADIRLYSGNTYALQSTDYRFRNNEGTTFSNDNGNLLCTITGAQSTTGIYINHSVTANKIIKVKIKVTDIKGTLAFQNGFNNGVKSIVKTGVYEVALINDSSSDYPNVYIVCNGSGNYATFIVEQIYVGNGSYVTPIIDNSGDNINATNNGGIAVQGVSGKGAYFPSANQYINIPTSKYPAPTSNDSVTLSVWINISSSYVEDSQGTCLKPILTVGAFSNLFGIVRNTNRIQAIFDDETGRKTVTVTMDKGIWHNYVGVFTNRKFLFYVDGVKIGETAEAIANFQFGKTYGTEWKIWSNTNVGGGANTTTNQPATLDDLLIFNRALTDDEVTALYLNKANTPKYYLWADWKLHQMEQS